MDMLNKKYSHKKIKPQVVKDADYLSWLHNEGLNCFVCGIQTGLEAHHVKEHSYCKRDDDKVIMLCYNHHHGLELSPHGTPVKFKEVYPMGFQYEVARELRRRYKDR